MVLCCMAFRTYIYFSSLSKRPIIRDLFLIICISYKKKTPKRRKMIPFLLSVWRIPMHPERNAYYKRYMNYSKATELFNTREQSKHVVLMLFHKKCDNPLGIRADCIVFLFFLFPRRRLELGLYMYESF